MPDRAPIPDPLAPSAPTIPPAPVAPVAGWLRWAWWLVAYLSLGLGLVGVVVPGLPTVPFILLSAYAAARGSARLHRWLLAHALFGPMIVDWQRGGTVARRAKWWASLSMAVCAVVMFLTAPQWWMAATGTGVMALVAGWLWLRPEPPIP